MRRQKAFTLVELLVVVGIISLLISILLPVLTKAMNAANRTVCQNNMRQLALSVVAYANDWGGRLPFANSDGLETWGDAQGNVWRGAGWLYKHPDRYNPNSMEGGSLWPLLQNRRVYRCPLDNGPYTEGTTHVLTSYMINASVNGNARVLPAFSIALFGSDKVVFMEANEGELAGGNWNDGNNNADNGLSSRHMLGGNVACFDGHVEWWTRDEFYIEAARKPGRLWCNPLSDTGD